MANVAGVPGRDDEVSPVASWPYVAEEDHLGGRFVREAWRERPAGGIFSGACLDFDVRGVLPLMAVRSGGVLP